MSSSSSSELPQDFEKAILKGLIKKVLKRLDSDEPLAAAEITAIHKLCTDNSVSFASIKAGEFGEVARKVAEEFPFDEAGNVVSIGGRP